MIHRQEHHAGFTLIEMSIVLVIIGLIVGGVLAGQELINLAKIRKQVSQIEEYKTAIVTFKLKYNCLPGDCSNAVQFGFQPRGSAPGEGDGNNLIESNNSGSGGGDDRQGESLVFWVDLSAAQLIPAGLSIGTFSTDIRMMTPETLYPRGALNGRTFLFAWSTEGINRLSIHGTGYYIAGTTRNDHTVVTPFQALSMDTKTDDGLPMTGRTTILVAGGPWQYWAINDDSSTWNRSYWFDTSAALAGSLTTCVDNNGVAGPNLLRYSTSQGNGTAPTCSLSFQF
ncbi:MAG: prepilin-type N-terminal cleavage/methylation domain-containing protein [Tepidisphaeraceae bacterium]